MPVDIILFRDIVQRLAITYRTPRVRRRVPRSLLALVLAAACGGADAGDAGDAPAIDDGTAVNGAAGPGSGSAPPGEIGSPDRTDTGSPNDAGSPAEGAPADERGTGAPTGAGWTMEATRVERSVRGAAVLRAIRTARHDGFDRVVLDFGEDDVPGHRVSFVDPPARQCGSGDAVTVAGGAVLVIGVEPVHAHTEAGEPTVRERSRATRLPALVELKLICDFEAVVELVAGVSSRAQYRTFTLRSPSRVVVDISHPAGS